MRTFILFFIMMSSSLGAVTIECNTPAHKFILQTAGQDLKITHQKETVLADGLLTNDEVDLVARFTSIGEMTLFARVGQDHPENYAFVEGKRFSVFCR